MISLISRLRDSIERNTRMNICVASSMMRGKTQIGQICNNDERNICRGLSCASIHAEANAIMSYYGKFLSYCIKRGWHQNSNKERKAEYYGNPN